MKLKKLSLLAAGLVLAVVANTAAAEQYSYGGKTWQGKWMVADYPRSLSGGTLKKAQATAEALKVKNKQLCSDTPITTLTGTNPSIDGQYLYAGFDCPYGSVTTTGNVAIGFTYSVKVRHYSVELKQKK